MFLIHQAQLEGIHIKDGLRIQVYLGLAWVVGCVVFGLIIVNNSSSMDCKVSRQYLCQTAMLLMGLTVLTFTAVDGYKGYVVFVWCFGIFCGGYCYSLKMYIYEKVRARNFGRTWGFAQLAMGFPTLVGVPVTGYANGHEAGARTGFLVSALFILTGSAVLFLINIHKNRLRQKRRCRRSRRTPESASVAPDGITVIPTSPNEVKSVNHSSGVYMDPSGDPDEILHSAGGSVVRYSVAKPAEEELLSDYSDEGIAGIDIPENMLLEDLEFADNITSCNKVENVLMLSEFEQNLSKEKEYGPSVDGAEGPSQKKPRKWSLFRQNINPDDESKTLKEIPTFLNTARKLPPGHKSRHQITVIDENC